jgi:hypothetical protein
LVNLLIFKITEDVGGLHVARKCLFETPALNEGGGKADIDIFVKDVLKKMDR